MRVAAAPGVQAGDQPATALDCLVIGAGAAGLTAAVYLARFRRRVAVLDGGTSRLLSIPTSHNYPGYAAGIHGPDALQRLREQAATYQVPIETATVERLARGDDGRFDAQAGARRWQARTVLLATGVTDVAPPFADVAAALGSGRLRYCPICDGFEAIGQRAAVLGRGNSGVQEAIFVRHFADSVHVCAIGDPLQPDEQERQQLDQAGVTLLGSTVTAVELVGQAPPTIRLVLEDGERPEFDVVYAALGTLPNSGLAQVLGARSSDNGELLVDEHQQTSVDGLYAAGDVVAGLNQIAVAMGHAAIAATAIHNRLRRR